MARIKTKHIGFRIPLETLEKLELMAYRRKVTLTEIIREALDQYVERQGMAS